MLGAILSGILLTLALPPSSFAPLGWVALVPLFVACRGTRFLYGFLLALATLGITGRLSIDGWLYQYRSTGGESIWIVLGCFMFGVIVAAIAGIYAELRKLTWRHIFGLSALAVLIETAMLPILPVTFALTESRATLPLTIAGIFGIWAVSWSLWAVNLWIADRFRVVPAGAAFAAYFFLSIALNVFYEKDPEEPFVPITLVQTDSSSLETLAKITGREGKSALAVWPEFSGLLEVHSGNASKLKALSKKEDLTFVTTFRDNATPLPHNVAALFQNGTESSRYAKRELFGGERSMHAAGDRPVAAVWDMESFGVSESPHKVGLSICFDSCFPGLTREVANLPGVVLVAVPTIDPPSPNHWLAAMHAAFMPFRAAENGVAFVRSDAYAYSNLTNKWGQVEDELPPGEATMLSQASLWTRQTIYSRIGDVFLGCCGVMIAIMLWPQNALRRLGRQVGKRIAGTRTPPPGV